MESNTAKSPYPKLKKHCGAFAVLIATAGAIYIAATLGLAYSSPTTKTLQRIWEQDIDNLSGHHKLPPSWSEISVVQKINANGDRDAERWARETVSPIEINPKGQYKLEVLFISQKSAGHEKVIVQHHMIHIPSGNSVWELGRTYQLN